MDAQNNIKSARRNFNKISNFSSKTELVKLLVEEIIAEIKTHHREKKLPKK